ncbi:MAG: AAA family ATPase [Bacteroidota bacterium]
MGQSNDFYENLLKLFSRAEAQEILLALNDVTYCKGLLAEFEYEEGFAKSLIRYSEAQKSFNEGERILLGIKTKNTFKFTFTTQVSGFDGPHVIRFGFEANSKLPRRLTALVGKNGSGKTQVLSRLATSLSGRSQLGVFNTKHLPPFSRIIAISYNLFDQFEKPKKTKFFSYYYCGVQTDSKLLSEKQIQKRIQSAVATVHKNGNIALLVKYIDELLGAEIADRLSDGDWIEERDHATKVYDRQGYSVLSSGQILMLLVVSEILAHIRKESLLLFDEPETHLHPNALSKLVSTICRILDKFDSYAIVATHSPQIIQEIPSSEIFVFANDENVPIVRKLGSETFGENLTILTEQIFQTVGVDEFYKKTLKDLSARYTKKQILKIFNESGTGLSLNAKIFLESLPKKRK